MYYKNQKHEKQEEEAQKTAKKMKEDAELIDEQLKIAKKYRIKEYE